MPNNEPDTFDGDEIEMNPADIAHPNDTEDIALQKLARRMSRIMEIPAEMLTPMLRSMVAAQMLEEEKSYHLADEENDGKSEPSSPQN